MVNGLYKGTIPTSSHCSTLLQILNKRIIVDGEIVAYELHSQFFIFALLNRIYIPPETGKVVRNRSAQGHQFSRNHQQYC